MIIVVTPENNTENDVSVAYSTTSGVCGICTSNPAMWADHPGMSEQLKQDLFQLFKTLRMQMNKEKELAKMAAQMQNQNQSSGEEKDAATV